MVLIVTAGAAMQIWAPSWGLIGTEALLILLPSLVLLWWQRLAPRETLRLRWPGWRVAGLSALIGAGVWLAASWLSVVVSLLAGYTLGTGPGFYPQTVGQALVTFAAFALFAPVCEEVLFRGLIQRGYERMGPRVAFWATAALFVVYHLSLQGLVSLVPIALALGYVVQRSRSLVSGMFVHAANNALAATLIITAGLRPEASLGVPSLPGAVAGAVLAGLGLWGLRRATRPAAEAAEAPPEGVEAGGWLGRAWPVALAALLFSGLAVVEVLAGRFPAIMANEPLALPEAPWTERTGWAYEIRNPVGETVGAAECALTPEASLVMLRCAGQHRAFEARKGLSYYSAGEGAWTLEWTWRRENLTLVDGSLQSTINGEPWETIEVLAGGTELRVESRTGVETLALPPNVLLVDEWPWRLATLPFDIGYGREATLAWPHQWDPELEASPPGLEETLVQVRGVEPLAGPHGAVEAWRVTVGGEQTAWYAVKAPHSLLRYDAGMLSYLLTGTASALD
jgi:membrane protease YdiL (CAAX protease family)